VNEHSSKLSQIVDFGSLNNRKSQGSREKSKKGSQEKKSLKKLNFKPKKAKMKNSTFDFTNFKTHVSTQKERANSRSKSREKHCKIDVSPCKDIESELKALMKSSKAAKKAYYIPVTAPHRLKEGKSSRSNSRTKTVAIKKVNFVKNGSQNLNIFPKMVSCNLMIIP
jgi:hypothetical protein